MPMTAWTPVPETAHEIAADRSPSPMSLIRAPGRADLGDQRLVARPLEDDDRDVADRRPSAAAIRRRFSVGLSRMSTLPAATGPDAQLLEVRVRGVDQAARLGRGEDRDRAGLAVGDEVGALERIDRDVDRGQSVASGVRAPDLLADVEHRRLVALALADDDRAGELDLVHRPAHGLDRGRVGLVLVAAAHEPGRSDRGRLGDADHLEGEQLFHRPPRPRWWSGAGRCSVPEVPPAGEDHRQVVAVGDLDRHLVADRAARLDDRGHAGVGGGLDPVGEREVGVATP